MATDVVAIPNDQINGTLAASEFSKAVTVQDAPPTVAGVTPQAGATGVGDEINVTATFSERPRPSTVNGTTFVLIRVGTSTRVPAVVRYDAERNRAILNPSEPLRAGATYVARVRGGENGIKDLVGKPLADTKRGASPSVGNAGRLNPLHVAPVPLGRRRQGQDHAGSNEPEARPAPRFHRVGFLERVSPILSSARVMFSRELA